MGAPSQISKDIEEGRAARRARAKAAAAPLVAEIQAEQASQAARPEADREHDACEAALAGIRFSRVRDYMVIRPRPIEAKPGWQYLVEYTTDGIDWLVGEVRFSTGPRGGRRIVLVPLADPTAPWLPQYAEER